MAIKLDRSKLTQGLATGFKLVPHLDKAIGEKEYDWSAEFKPKQGDDAWHPSGDCTPSLQELYQKATGQVDPWVPGIGLRKAFMVGHCWHAYLQFIACDVLEFCEPESVERRGIRGWGEPDKRDVPEHLDTQEVNPFYEATAPFFWLPYYYATGSGDLAPISIPQHGDYVVDFKTMGSHDFKQSTIPAWCKEKYECQINIYMDFFDLEKALIVCINKDSPHDMKEFEYERNQPLIDAIYTKWELVSACLEAGVEPPADEVIELPLRTA